MKKFLCTSILLTLFGNLFAATVTTSKATYLKGEYITVNFTGATAAKDWIGLYKAGQTPSIITPSTDWDYVDGTQTGSKLVANGSVTFNPGLSATGDYTVYLCANDGYRVLASANFKVVDPYVAGEWLFDNPLKLTEPAIGPSLELVGTQSAVAGPTATDGAVRIGVGSHFKLTHGLLPNNGACVNTYSILYDFKVNDLNSWRSFLQTDAANTDDAELFIKPTAGTIGLSTTGYSTKSVVPGMWNRLVVVVNNGTEYSLYLNGEKILTGTKQNIDGTFGLKPQILLFGDDNGEDGEIDVAKVTLYYGALTQANVQTLGVPVATVALNSNTTLSATGLNTMQLNNSDIVVSSGELIFDQSSTVRSITVQPGAKLTLANGKNITTTGALTLESDANATATFIDQNTTPATITATAKQYLSQGRNWYISSPVSAATTAAISTAGSVSYWNESTGSWATTGSGSALNPAKGYISVGTTSNGCISFSGTLNSGSKSIALTRTTGKTKEGFNLVGNPYPSYLNWTQATATAANVLSTIWYRTKTDAGYAFHTFNASGSIGVPADVTGVIPPMQGFWVRANSGGGTLTFNNSMRTHASGSSNKLKAPVQKKHRTTSCEVESVGWRELR